MLIYDIEIIKAIPTGARKKNIEYCKGWDDQANMGISVICAYDYIEDRPRIFLEDTFQEFEQLARNCLVVGFNSESFDDKVCAANAICVKTGYDILRECYKAKGLLPYPKKFDDRYKGYGLNALAQATLGMQKTGYGAKAPIDWQKGRRGSVIDYCMNDVMLIKKLFDQILAGLALIDPINKKNLFLERP